MYFVLLILAFAVSDYHFGICILMQLREVYINGQCNTEFIKHNYYTTNVGEDRCKINHIGSISFVLLDPKDS